MMTWKVRSTIWFYFCEMNGDIYLYLWVYLWIDPTRAIILFGDTFRGLGRLLTYSTLSIS